MLAFIIDHRSWTDLVKLVRRTYGVLRCAFHKSVVFIYIAVYSGDNRTSLLWLHLKIVLFKVWYYWWISKLDYFIRRCRWPRGLRHGSGCRSLDGFCRFESLQLHRCLSVVNVVCCQVQLEVYATGRSPRPEESYRVCVIKKNKYVLWRNVHVWLHTHCYSMTNSVECV